MKLTIQPNGSMKITASTSAQLLEVFRGVREDRRKNDIPQRIIEALAKGQSVVIGGHQRLQAIHEWAEERAIEPMTPQYFAHHGGNVSVGPFASMEAVEQWISDNVGVPRDMVTPATEFRYFKDADGFFWKMPVDGSPGFLRRKGDMWLEAAGLETLSVILESEGFAANKRIETDADGNPLASEPTSSEALEDVHGPIAGEAPPALPAISAKLRFTVKGFFGCGREVGDVVTVTGFESSGNILALFKGNVAPYTLKSSDDNENAWWRGLEVVEEETPAPFWRYFRDSTLNNREWRVMSDDSICEIGKSDLDPENGWREATTSNLSTFVNHDGSLTDNTEEFFPDAEPVAETVSEPQPVEAITPPAQVVEGLPDGFPPLPENSPGMRWVYAGQGDGSTRDNRWAYPEAMRWASSHDLKQFATIHYIVEEPIEVASIEDIKRRGAPEFPLETIESNGPFVTGGWPEAEFSTLPVPPPGYAWRYLSGEALPREFVMKSMPVGTSFWHNEGEWMFNGTMTIGEYDYILAVPLKTESVETDGEAS